MHSAGLEPGLDPDGDGLGQDSRSTLHTECQITVVEFSEDHIEQVLQLLCFWQGLNGY
jgi:hypothetical protein